tara:strand:+ start:2849 stop:3133 length:285 start_codon:yes stop_codon:yes gene_type:complete
MGLSHVINDGRPKDDVILVRVPNGRVRKRLADVVQEFDHGSLGLGVDWSNLLQVNPERLSRFVLDALENDGPGAARSFLQLSPKNIVSRNLRAQ